MTEHPAVGSGTDPEVRREIVENVRRFVAREVAPHVAAQARRRPGGFSMLPHL